MVILCFDKEAIPRTTTRKEWKEIWHWKRVTEKSLAKAVEEQLFNLRTYGHSMLPEMKAELMDRIINPPIMVYPEPKQW